MIPDYNGITAMVGDTLESACFPDRHCRLIAVGDNVVLQPIDWIPAYRSVDDFISIPRRVWDKVACWRVV